MEWITTIILQHFTLYIHATSYISKQFRASEIAHRERAGVHVSGKRTSGKVHASGKQTSGEVHASGNACQGKMNVGRGVNTLGSMCTTDSVLLSHHNYHAINEVIIAQCMHYTKREGTPTSSRN